MEAHLGIRGPGHGLESLELPDLDGGCRGTRKSVNGLQESLKKEDEPGLERISAASRMSLAESTVGEDRARRRRRGRIEGRRGGR